MRLLYEFVFTCFFILTAPFYFLKMWRRGNWQTGFGQRFGRFGPRIKSAITNRHVLWIHAVSVGEVNIATQLIRVLETRVPNLKILVSTTTSTGMGELQRKLPSHVEKIYYPIDRRRYADRALRVLNPEVFVLVESEIWPNFIWRAAARGVPLFLVNARLSDRSYRGYKLASFLFRPIFASFTGVGAQNEHDAKRLIELGCRAESLHVVGSLKFDAARIDERPTVEIQALLRQIGVQPDSLIIVGGSTHAGEEALLARIYRRLQARFPQLFLVLVPRHFERGNEVGAELKQAGVRFAYRTEISPQTRFEPGEVECLLVNTTGELRYFYEEAAVIFVGKSLSAEGGQNPIEPAALGKAVIFGPNMQNFRAIAEEFVRNEAAIQVQSQEELETALARLLGDPQARTDLGQHALQVVRKNRGAIDRTVDMIVKHLKGGEVYLAPDVP